MSSTTTCTLTVTGPATVTARFGERPTVRLTLTTVGNGSVTVDGRPCSPSCEFLVGDTVELRASYAPGEQTLTWSNGCATDECSVQLLDAEVVAAL